MPQVTLDLVSLDDKPVAGVSRRFEGTGGTIGRDEGNTLPLPDPQRRVSRLHATISFPGDVPTITNSSSVLNIDAGGTQLKSGQAIALTSGMSLGIGPYVLVVRPFEAPTRIAPPAAAPVAQAAPIAPLAAPPAAAAAGPFASLLSARGPNPPAAGVPAPVPAAPLQPVDDPLAGLLGSPGLAAPAAGGRGAPGAADPFEMLSPGPNPGVPRAAPMGSGSREDPLAALGNGPAHGADPFAGRAKAPGTGSDPFAALAKPPAAASDPFAALAQAPGSNADPFAEFARAPAAGTDPFAGLGSAPAFGAANPGPLPAGAAPEYPPPPAVVIPEDFNPFDLPSASARNTADPLSSMLGGAAPASPHALTQGEESIDALFAPAGASVREQFLKDNVSGAGPFGAIAGEPSSLLAQPGNSDPLALFGASASGPESLGRPMRDDLAEIGGAYQPPRAMDPLSFAPPLQAPPPAGAHADPFKAPAAPSYAADGLAQAFLAGARLPATALPNGLTPEIMAMVGSLLRSATAGAIDMLAIRANIKREVQASVTIISTEANNPLKFLPDADSVLQQLLGKRMPGFMRPDEAMNDAFNDLRAHELGVIAGTRAALDEVLSKFDPAILGERLVRGSLLEKALPAMRKTRLWDLYLERYAQLRREVEDDFQSVFGKAFVAAYEAEIARMKARSPSGVPR